MKRKFTLETASTSLHLMAMAIMLCDHCKRLFPDAIWLPCVGRLAFPIFAFLIVEGYHHTQDLNRYARRLLFFAILAEVPFDLMANGIPFHSGHQNVLWTFLLALGLVHINAVVKKRSKLFLQIPVAALTVVLGYHLGKFTNVDYMQAGVLTVLMFYFFRGRRWWNFALQFAALAYINFEMLGSYAMEFTIWGHAFSFPRQGLAMLALIPIWLYRGKQGYHSKWMQYLNYGFYPGHMLVIAVLAGSASPGMLLAFPAVAVVVLVWRLMGEKARAIVQKELDELEGFTLVRVAVTVAVLLLAVMPFVFPFFLTVEDADAVTIQYAEDPRIQEDELRWVILDRVSSTDPEIVAQWIAFQNEAAPLSERTKPSGSMHLSRIYMVDYYHQEIHLATLWVTPLESVIYDRLSDKAAYVGYSPVNDHYFEVGCMMKELEGS